MKNIGLQKKIQLLQQQDLNPAELQEILIDILETKEVGKRNPRDIALICLGLKQIDFFKKLQEANGDQAIQLCATQLGIEHHPAGKDVIVHGEKGDKFYIIFSGIMEVHVPTSSGAFVKVAEMKPGQSFGELALINDSPRRATIRAQTDCDLAILSKKDYIKIIADMEQREIQKKIDFLESISFFSRAGRRALHEYIYYFKIVSFQWKEVVFNIDEVPKFVYIIRSGEFALSKANKGNKHQSSGLFPKVTQVALIGPGQIFGEMDCLVQRRHLFKVTCNSQSSEVFVITKQHFMERIMDNHAMGAKDFIRSYVKQKLEWEMQRMNVIQNTKHLTEDPHHMLSKSPPKKSQPPVLNDIEVPSNPMMVNSSYKVLRPNSQEAARQRPSTTSINLLNLNVPSKQQLQVHLPQSQPQQQQQQPQQLSQQLNSSTRHLKLLSPYIGPIKTNSNERAYNTLDSDTFGSRVGGAAATTTGAGGGISSIGSTSTNNNQPQILKMQSQKWLTNMSSTGMINENQPTTKTRPSTAFSQRKKVTVTATAQSRMSSVAASKTRTQQNNSDDLRAKPFQLHSSAQNIMIEDFEINSSRAQIPILYQQSSQQQVQQQSNIQHQPQLQQSSKKLPQQNSQTNTESWIISKTFHWHTHTPSNRKRALTSAQHQSRKNSEHPNIVDRRNGTAAGAAIASLPSPKANRILNKSEMIQKSIMMQDDDEGHKNSGIDKLELINRAKLQVCREKNILVQSANHNTNAGRQSSQFNIGLFEEFALPKHVQHRIRAKFSNSSSASAAAARKRSTSVANPIGNDNNSIAHTNSSYESPQSSNKQHLGYNNNNQSQSQQHISTTSCLSSRQNNDKIKKMINRIKQIDQKQYQIHSGLYSLSTNSSSVHCKYPHLTLSPRERADNEQDNSENVTLLTKVGDYHQQQFYTNHNNYHYQNPRTSGSTPYSQQSLSIEHQHEQQQQQQHNFSPVMRGRNQGFSSKLKAKQFTKTNLSITSSPAQSSISRKLVHVKISHQGDHDNLSLDNI